MSVAHAPVIGNWYSVLCPVCGAQVTYDCRSRSVYGIQCSACRNVIDLRNPTVPLPRDDIGIIPDGSAAVDYSPLVMESQGLSATEQVAVITASVMEEEMREMPATIGGETSQALMARRMQSMAKRLSFMHPLVNTIELVTFGTRPLARIGNVQIFRSRLPLFEGRNVPVPQTSVSYAAPLAVVIVLFSFLTWSVFEIGTKSLINMYLFEIPLVIVLVASMLRVVYMDPGFVRPAFLARDTSRGDALALKDIEANQRESLWETIDGQQYERKWCSTCEMHRPLRAAHCYLCGMCVMNHDHHCTVIGACIGARNAGMFTFFTFISTVATLLPCLAIMTELYGKGESLTFIKFCICMIVAVALGITALAVASLTVSMCYNLMMDITTRERLQHVYATKRNPFDRGILRNLRHLFFGGKSPDIFNEEFVGLCAERV